MSSPSRDLGWLTPAEVSALTGRAPRTIQLAVKRGELQSKFGPARGRNGRRARLISAASLDADAQLKLAQLRLAAPAKEEGEQLNLSAQISLFQAPPSIPRELRLSFNEAQRLEADRRLNAISPLLEFRRRSNGHRPVFETQDGRQLRSMDGLAAYLAEQHRVTSRTIWRWYRAWMTGGYAALADDTRSDKGSFRSVEKCGALLDAGLERKLSLSEYLQRKYLAERLSIRLAHQAMLRDWPQGAGEAPCYQTVRRFLAALPKPIVVMAREGKHEFQERCAPYLITKPPEKPNLIWTSDHSPHDVWVCNADENGEPYFSGVAPWQPLRVYMTAIMDLCSRKVWAVHAPTPSSDTISSALRLAIVDVGLPDTFYTDNGKDYKSVGKVDLSPAASGLLARLGVNVQFCIPKHPQSKGMMEGWFGNWRGPRFDHLWSKFYAGNSPATRPESCGLMLKQHAKLARAGRVGESPLPRASEFVRMAQQFVAEYNDTPGTVRPLRGKSPNEIYAELLPPSERRMLPAEPGKPHDLDVLFWQRKQCRVREGGCVQLRARYEPADGDSAARLFMEIERDILVVCDPLNVGEAVALDLDNHFLGRLRAQKLIERGPISRDDVRAGMRLQRATHRAVRKYIEFLSQGHTTELQHLARRAGVPPTIDAPALPSPRQLPECITHIYTEDSVEQLVRLMDQPTPAKKVAATGGGFIEDVAADFLKEGGE
jgi:hypothetical protein